MRAKVTKLIAAVTRSRNARENIKPFYLRRRETFHVGS